MSGATVTATLTGPRELVHSGGESFIGGWLVRFSSSVIVARRQIASISWSPRCVRPVTFPRQRQSILIFMTALAVIFMLVTALGLGYHFGRRAGSTTSTWKKRTRQTTLARHAISLIALMMLGRIQRSVQRRLPGSPFWRTQAGRGQPVMPFSSGGWWVSGRGRR